jgi:hypothetical protein
MLPGAKAITAADGGQMESVEEVVGRSRRHADLTLWSQAMVPFVARPDS